MIRYAIDTRYHIIIVMNSIQLVFNEEIEVHIGWEMLRHLELQTFLTYRMGAFHEKTDTISLLKLYKVCVLNLNY